MNWNTNWTDIWSLSLCFSSNTASWSYIGLGCSLFHLEMPIMLPQSLLQEEMFPSLPYEVPIMRGFSETQKTTGKMTGAKLWRDGPGNQIVHKMSGVRLGYRREWAEVRVI